jgi:hypothetical protein
MNLEEKIITTDDIDSDKTEPDVPFDNESSREESLPDENGNSDSIDIGLERVREKTFNKELSDLVEKIRSHELSEEQEEEEDLPDITASEIREDDLLRKYHNLFYHAINLIGINNINASFNQFDLSLNSIKDELEKYIDDEMRALSFPCYSVLYYNLEKKCYVPCINHINELDENNIIIDPNEEFCKNIYEHSSGIIIGSRTVNNNIYLKKRFSLSGQAGARFSYYFISLRNLTSDFYSGIERSAGKNLPDRSLFPILMILLNEEETAPESIFYKIRDRLAVHFIFLARKLIMKTHNTKAGNHSDLFNTMGHNFKLFQGDSEGGCFIIKCSSHLTKETLFVLKYLHIKLKESLSKRSIISRIEKDKFVILINKPEVRILNRVVMDFNKFYNNIFVLKEFKIGIDNLMEVYCA